MNKGTNLEEDESEVVVVVLLLLGPEDVLRFSEFFDLESSAKDIFISLAWKELPFQTRKSPFLISRLIGL